MSGAAVPRPVSSEVDAPWGQVFRQLAVLVSVPMFAAFSAAKEDVLPDKYFADSHHIESLGIAASGPSADSFITMAWLYRLVGAFDYPSITYLATLLLFFVVVFRSVSWAGIGRFGPLEMILFVFCGAEASIYLAQYSKESVIVLLALVLLSVPRQNYGDAIFITMTCGYAYLIRSYWFIVVVLFLGFRLLLRSDRIFRLPVFVAGALLVLACAVKLVMGVDLNSFRTVVNESNGLYAQSAIKDYIPSSGPVGGALNAMLTLVLLIVPLPLLVAFSPTYLAFGAIISTLWVAVLRVIYIGARQGWFRTDVRLSRAVSLLLAMLTVQAIFEPDYGSYLKHLTPLLPLFFLPLAALARAALDRTVREHAREDRYPMTLSSTIRTLLRTWYLAVPCLVLSCALAGLALNLVPAHYTSTGLAMVVQPRRAGDLKASNPLLGFETSLNTTAVMLSQSLNAPQSAAALGVGSVPTNKYTVKNVGDTNTGGDPNQPFIYVTAQGSTPEATASLVESVLSLARQQLAEQQRSLRVANQDSVRLATITDASTPTLAPGLSLAAATGAFCAGAALTLLLCLFADRRIRARERSRALRDLRLASPPLAPFTPEHGHLRFTPESNNASNPSVLRP